MTKIILNFDYDSDLVACPVHVAENLRTYQKKFDRYLSNRNNDHGYWTKDCENGDALCFDGDAFVTFLNESVISKESEKAYFIKRNFIPDSEEKSFPHINF